MAAGYCAPSQKDFESKYLPLLKDFVVYDGQTLTLKDKVFMLEDDDKDDGEQAYSLIRKLGIIVYDWKAPVVSDIKNTARLQELKDQIIKGQLPRPKDFEFNNLPTYSDVAINNQCSKVTILTHRGINATLYIGFTRNGYFYPVIPQIVPEDIDVNDINNGNCLILPTQPYYNHTLKDGIYYNNRQVNVYYDGTLLLNIEWRDSSNHMIQYDNGITIGNIDYNRSAEGTCYHDGICQSYCSYDVKGVLDGYTGYHGDVKHGRYYRKDETHSIEANYDNGFLSGKLEYINLLNSKITHQRYFRREAGILNYTSGILYEERHAFVGISKYKFDDYNEILRFNGDGCYDGIQLYYSGENTIEKLLSKRGLGDFSGNSVGCQLQRYFIHGKEYTHQDYEIIVNKRILDIKAVTRFPLDLIKIVLEY